MIYINLEDLSFPHHQGDIRIEHPEIGDEFVCPPTFALVEIGPEPVIDRSEYKLGFSTPYQQDGAWRVNFVPVPLSAEEKANQRRKPSEMQRNPEIRAIMEKLEKQGLVP